MKKELFNKVLSLNDSIAPQYFSVQEEGICYFDRVNIEEGRFWHVREGRQSIVLETDGGQGVLDEKGNMYVLNAGEKTTLIPIINNKNGEPIELPGLFYDFKISHGGSYVFLGNDNGSNLIHITNSNGVTMAEIHIPELVFASCLALDKENIYVGGIEKGGGLVIACLNYLGSINKCWSLVCSPKERLVGKLQLYGNKIIVLIGGTYDTIGVLDIGRDDFKEISMKKLSIKSCADLQVFNDQLYLLSGKSIMSMDVEELEELADVPAYGMHKRNREHLSYEYLMYTRSMRSQAISSVLPGVIFSSLITLMLMITGQIAFAGYLQQGEFQLLMAVVGVYLIASLKNITALADKASRVDSLLSLYNESGSLASRFAFPCLASFTIFAFVYLLGYPGIGSMYGWIAGAVAMIMFSAIQIRSLRKLKREKDDVIVELLREDDLETEMSIRAVLRSMKRQGCEEMLIKIATEDKAIMRRINKWASTRKGIIGDLKPAQKGEDTISVTLDFSRRDIRYSRFSIAMDYISYLKNSTIISAMDIQCCSSTEKLKK